MSNKLKIILAVITSILVVSGSAIIFNSQRRNNSVSKTELSSLSSSSSIVSSSISSQVSSVSVSSSSLSSVSSLVSAPSSEITKSENPIISQILVSQTPIVEKPKAVVPVQPIPNPVVVPKVITPTNYCNIQPKDGMQIVYSGNNCFGLYKFVKIQLSGFKGDGFSQQIKDILTPLATDYYSRVKLDLVTKKPIVSYKFLRYISNTQAEITISTYDKEYINILYNNNPPSSDNLNYKEATYTIKKTNGTWTYSFKQFN